MMELKKVEKQEIKGYAKKNEITEKEMKKAVPKKWVAASALGIATLLFSGSSSGLSRIGVVFGCIPTEVINHTQLWHILDNIHTVFYYFTQLSFIYILYCIINHALKKKENSEENKQKKVLQDAWKIALVIILITLLFSIFLSLDFSFFYEGGIRVEGYSGFANGIVREGNRPILKTLLGIMWDSFVSALFFGLAGVVLYSLVAIVHLIFLIIKNKIKHVDNKENIKKLKKTFLMMGIVGMILIYIIAHL